MSNMIIGPVLQDIIGTGLGGRDVVIATAFYTAGPLEKINVTAERLTLAVRLDTGNLKDWVNGSIDPAALLSAVKRFSQDGVSVMIYAGTNAHAKIYLGEKSALIGSANLTTRGLLGVGDEAMWAVLRKGADGRKISNGVRKYLSTLKQLSIDELDMFVGNNIGVVKKARKKAKPEYFEANPSRIDATQRPERLGTYDDFLAWLEKCGTKGASETLDRARGKANLTGHIWRNYHGIRQYLIHSPGQQNRFSKASEDDYKLSKDPATESDISDFVRNYAVIESEFDPDRWKTYLPIECGGRAGRHGGTIGNLNKMLPLVAKYMSKRLGGMKK